MPSRPNAGYFLSLLVTLLTVGVSRADVFHLKAGGSVDGLLLETRDDMHVIRTAAGVVHLPAKDVDRVEPAPTPFEEYDRRAGAVGDSAAAHVELADWCGEQGLRGERRKHLLRALALDPDYAPARRALGYVRIGDLWLDARPVGGKRPAGPAQEDSDAERLVRAIQIRWERTIRLIYDSMLKGKPAEQREPGRKRVLEIRDPLVILPMAEVLTNGDLPARRLLLEALRRFPEDEATMSLGAMALLEPDDDLRAEVIQELGRRRDPRVIAQLRGALHTDSDVLLRRAAAALGALGAKDAVGELIDVLTTQRNQPVQVPVREYFGGYPRVFLGGTGVGAGGVCVGGNCTPGVAQMWWEGFGYWTLPSDLRNTWTRQTVTVMRTEVLEALRRLTGQDFGFEQGRWVEWYIAQRESYGRRSDPRDPDTPSESPDKQ